MLQWWLVAARPDAARRESKSAAIFTTASVAGWLHDTGSIRLARRRHLLQWRLVAAGTPSANRLDCDQVKRKSRRASLVHSSGERDMTRLSGFFCIATAAVTICACDGNRPPARNPAAPTPAVSTPPAPAPAPGPSARSVNTIFLAPAAAAPSSATDPLVGRYQLEIEADRYGLALVRQRPACFDVLCLPSGRASVHVDSALRWRFFLQFLA